MPALLHDYAPPRDQLPPLGFWRGAGILLIGCGVLELCVIWMVLLG